MRNFFFCLCVLYGVTCFAQNAISGQVNIKDMVTLEEKVHLTKTNGDESEVAIARIKKDGSFSFRKEHISDKNTIYRIYVKRMEKAIKDTIALDQKFILSSSDEIRFKEGPELFNGYVNTNSADAEWQNLKSFQENLAVREKNIEDTISEAYAIKLKSYAKDSLKILMVKLMGIQQLENKGLLDTDIAENTVYYLALLEELKESDLAVSEYLFLQKKLAYLTQDIVVAKYQWSRSMNIALGLVVIGLLFFVIHLKKKAIPTQIDLSKQESNIKKLILEGKTNKEIANELFISISTVKTHITNIYSKLKVSSRQELVRRMQN